MKKLTAILFTLSILSTVSPACAGGRDGGNGPVFLKCSELSGLTLHERRQHLSGMPEKCIPDNTDNPVPEDNPDSNYGVGKNWD